MVGELVASLRASDEKRGFDNTMKVRLQIGVSGHPTSYLNVTTTAMVIKLDKILQ